MLQAATPPYDITWWPYGDPTVFVKAYQCILEGCNAQKQLLKEQRSYVLYRNGILALWGDTCI